MRSLSIPATITAEALGKWITDNSKDQIIHKEEIPLEDEEIKKLEHKSSMASRKIDELKALTKTFIDYIKGGTPVDHDVEVEIGDEPQRTPMTIVIGPTKGVKELTKNREFADQQLSDGFEVKETKLYMIPVPEDERMVAVDIEGTEFEQYNREMNELEKGKQPYLYANREVAAEAVTQFPDRAESSPKNKKKKKRAAETAEAEDGAESQEDASVSETSEEKFI